MGPLGPTTALTRYTQYRILWIKFFTLYLLQNYAVSLVATLVPVIYNQHNKTKHHPDNQMILLLLMCPQNSKRFYAYGIYPNIMAISAC